MNDVPEDQRLLTRRDGHVAHIVFNNPARHNAMSLSMWRGLSERLEAFAADREVRVVVLSGAGGRAFVSGADISEFGEQRGSDRAAEYDRIADAAEAAVAGFPKPILAKIAGYCLGGGLGIAIGCDMRICSESSSFGIPAGKLGLGYTYDGVARVLRTVGPAATAELFMTADRLPAAEALRLGLVNRVAPDGGLNAEVDALARKIASNAPLTLAAFKAAVQAHFAPAGSADLEQVERMVAACFASRDYAEGQKAFAERRPAVFRGE
jgi:enoyl-CoA hydratase